MILLDLENCDAGYSPTRWQREPLPGGLPRQVEVIFDGVDTDVWRRRSRRAAPADRRPRRPRGARGSSPTSPRGFESMRGFDIFMKVGQAHLPAPRPTWSSSWPASDRVCYGGDQKHIGREESSSEYVLAQDDYDLSKFVFTGRSRPASWRGCCR